MKENKPDLFTEDDLAESVEKLATLPFFPSESRGAVMTELRKMCPSRTALRWSVDEVVNHCETWPGLAGLRGILCTRFNPADGVDQWSTLPGYRAEDGEAKSYERHLQITGSESRLESRKLLAALMPRVPTEGDDGSVLDGNATGSNMKPTPARSAAPTWVKARSSTNRRGTARPRSNSQVSSSRGSKGTDGLETDPARTAPRADGRGADDAGIEQHAMRILSYSANLVELEIKSQCGTQIRSLPLAEAEQLLSVKEDKAMSKMSSPPDCQPLREEPGKPGQAMHPMIRFKQP